MYFVINGRKWDVKRVQRGNSYLRRKDGTYSLASTDNDTSTVYVLESVQGRLRERVMLHEVSHCVCFSYGIKIPIEQEEFLADWMSVHGQEVIRCVQEIWSDFDDVYFISN